MLKHHVAELQKELGDWQRRIEVLSGKTAGSLRTTAKSTLMK